MIKEIQVAPDVRIPTEELVRALFLVIDENDISDFHRKRLKKKIRKNADKGSLDMDLPPEWAWRICAAQLCNGNLNWWGWETRSEIIWDLCNTPWQYPPWDGKPCNLYLVAEQGVGDEILFSNAYQRLLQVNPTTTIECDSRLIPALERTFGPHFTSRWRNGVGDALPLNIPRGEYDAFMPAGNALKSVIRKPQDFRSNWILMHPLKTQFWRHWLDQFPRPHIGVTWVGRQGGVDPKVFQQEGTLFNLNYDGTPGYEKVPITFQKCHGQEEFDEMWHFISALDRVDSVPNSTVHMAGAVGVPCYVIKTPPMYGEINNRLQWQFGKLSRHFYPKMKVFQTEEEYGAAQKTVGDT